MGLKIKLLSAGLVAAIGLLGANSYWMYNLGKNQEQAAQYVRELENLINKQEKLAESESKTVEVVTEYVDKVIEVEKKVPVYVDRIKEIFSWDDSIIIPNELARVYQESICGSAGNANSPRCAPERTPAPVTLGQFAEHVINNHSVCESNAISQSSLIQWIKEQDKIINNQN